MSKSPSLRRIQADVRELALDPSDRYNASPLENDMFEWYETIGKESNCVGIVRDGNVIAHINLSGLLFSSFVALLHNTSRHFTIRGADGTDFEGGIYHGRILLPPEYPFKPPHIMFLTPSGRFETNTKICLSFSAYHPELWQPAWGIRLILEALISFLPTPSDGAIGALNWSSKERKRIAKLSQDYCCANCGKIASLLPELDSAQKQQATKNRFEREILELQRMQSQAHQPDSTILKQVDTQGSDASTEDNGGGAVMDSDTNMVPLVDEDVILSPRTGAMERLNDDMHVSSGSVEVPNERSGIPAASVPDMNEREPNVRIQEPTPTDQQQAPAALNEPLVPVVREEEESGARQLPEEKVSILTDATLQAAIIILSAICFLLTRKILRIVDEIRVLEES
jgi:ubiquitin-conjugating enzyme E2 J1